MVRNELLRPKRYKSDARRIALSDHPLRVNASVAPPTWRLSPSPSAHDAQRTREPVSPLPPRPSTVRALRLGTMLQPGPLVMNPRSLKHPLLGSMLRTLGKSPSHQCRHVPSCTKRSLQSTLDRPYSVTLSQQALIRRVARLRAAPGLILSGVPRLRP